MNEPSVLHIQRQPIRPLHYQCSQLVTGFQLVQGQTLDVRHRPLVNQDALRYFTILFHLKMSQNLKEWLKELASALSQPFLIRPRVSVFSCTLLHHITIRRYRITYRVRCSELMLIISGSTYDSFFFTLFPHQVHM